MLSSSCSSRPCGTLWRYCTDRSLCSFAGPEVGAQATPPPQGRDAQKNGNCTKDLFFCCVDRRAHVYIQGLRGPCGLHVTGGGQGGYKPFCTNACSPAHSFVQEYATEGLAGPTCQLRHVTWPDCMPGHTARLPPASPASSSGLDFSLHHFYF